MVQLVLSWTSYRRLHRAQSELGVMADSTRWKGKHIDQIFNICLPYIVLLPTLGNNESSSHRHVHISMAKGLYLTFKHPVYTYTWKDR